MARWPVWCVVLATAIFVLFFGASNWFRQMNLLTSQFDMGNMEQVLWHSLHGQWFQLTSPIGPVLQLRTAIHADYLLLAYLPFYALFPDPRTLLVLQVAAVASGVLPLFWLARKRLGAQAGALVAILYLLYPTLEWAVSFDVHAVVLATPLFLWAWWAAVERRWWLYAVMAALAVLAKEEVGLVVAALGFYWVWQRGYRSLGWLSLVLGVGWSVVMVALAIPHARHAPGHFALAYYSDFGDSYSGILRNAFAHPLKALAIMFDWQGLTLLRALLLPVGFVAVLGLPVLLIALPELVINLLSKDGNQQTVYFQYMSVITPFVFLALIDGWDRGQRWLKRWPVRLPGWQLSRWTVAAVVLAAGASVWQWSTLPGTRHWADALKVFQPSPYRQAVRRVRQSLRPTDRVAATNNVVPQFSQRNLIWGFPNDLDKADAVIVLEGGEHDLLPKQEIQAAVERLTLDPTFQLVFHRDQFWYFRRK